MTNDSKQYENTIQYLYSLQKHGIKLGLSNTNKLMSVLGGPHKSFRCVHIAGTNGKGSTASCIASILKASGFKTGLFTSPHLVSFTERIRINGRQITELEVIELASSLRSDIKDTDLNPTFFEFVTAMAFNYFAANHVDWAVIETGMGGRLDATNVVQPEVTVITNISLDHCEFLGSTLSDIAFEKAGIIKPGVPLITASHDTAVIKQLSDIAAGLNSAVHIYGRDFTGILKQMDCNQITIDYSGYANYSNVSIPLTGRYQLYNACTAIRTCEILRAKGVPLPDASIMKGLKDVRLEGRLERISDSPPIFLDGAHNPEAARSLAASVRDIFPDKKVILVIGVMSDKDIKETMAPLMEIAETVILTKAQYERAASPEKMRNILSSVHLPESNSRPPSLLSTASISEALHLAKSLCAEKGIILITGSFYTTGEAKEVMGHKAILSKLRE